MSDNPVLDVIETVAEKQEEFTGSELGLKDEDLKEAMEAVMRHLGAEAQRIHGLPAIREEDLYYLFLLGLCAGYELHKVQQGEKADAED